MDLPSFFQVQGVGVFSEVSVDALPDMDRSFIREFFPCARFVIVFGREVPVAVYRMPAREKTREMVRIAESLDTAAARLAACLETEHIPARPVPLYLPVRIADGRVQGVVRLKQVAAAGGLGSPGRNTVLLSPRFGPRLLLGGVVTGGCASDTGPARSSSTGDVTPLCSGCGQCIAACPGGALGPDGIDAFRCRDVSAWVPPVLVPAAKWMLGRTMLLKCLAPLSPWVARIATIPCSRCVTECRKFSGEPE